MKHIRAVRHPSMYSTKITKSFACVSGETLVSHGGPGRVKWSTTPNVNNVPSNGLEFDARTKDRLIILPFGSVPCEMHEMQEMHNKSSPEATERRNRKRSSEELKRT